jgi:hypothetical protein
LHGFNSNSPFFARSVSYCYSEQFGPKGFNNVKDIQQLDFGFNKLTGSIPDKFPKEWNDPSRVPTSRISVFAFDHNELSGLLPTSLCNLTQVFNDNNCMLEDNHFDKACPSSCDGLPMKGAPTKLMKCFYQICYAKCHNNEKTSPCWETVHAHGHLNAKCSALCTTYCTTSCPSVPCSNLANKKQEKCPPTPPSMAPVF